MDGIKGKKVGGPTAEELAAALKSATTVKTTTPVQSQMSTEEPDNKGEAQRMVEQEQSSSGRGRNRREGGFSILDVLHGQDQKRKADEARHRQVDIKFECAKERRERTAEQLSDFLREARAQRNSQGRIGKNRQHLENMEYYGEEDYWLDHKDWMQREGVHNRSAHEDEDEKS